MITVSWDHVLQVCASITCIAGAVAVLYNLWKKARTPESKQNERITNLEARIARHDELFAKDQRRLEALEEGNRVTQKALLALLAQGIDGNAVDAMKTAKKTLEDYLLKNIH